MIPASPYNSLPPEQHETQWLKPWVQPHYSSSRKWGLIKGLIALYYVTEWGQHPTNPKSQDTPADTRAQ